MSEEFEVRGLDSLQKKLAEMLAKIAGNPVVKVGFFEGSTAGWSGPRPRKGKRSTVKADEAKGGSAPAAFIAMLMNIGNPGRGLPARPFWDNWKEKHGHTWGDLIAAGLVHTNYNAKAALELCGVKMAEQLKKEIAEFSGEPLSPKTIAAKGFDTPLIDSHGMINAVDFKVEA